MIVAQNRLGYDTRSWRSALVMGAIDAIRPWHRPDVFHLGKSTVVSSVAGLGDLFIHMPLIAGLVADHHTRGIPLRVALRPALVPIGQACGWDVLPFDNALAEFFKTPLKTNPSEVLRRIRAARSDAPELWIDLSGNAVNALLIKLAGARRLASRITRGGQSFIDHALPHTLQENEYGNRERAAGYLGCQLDFSVFAKLSLPSPAPGAIVLSITTACRWRNWPLANVLHLVNAFPNRKFALVGFRREILPDEQAVFHELATRPNVTDLLDRLKLMEMIGLVATAPAVITNDTSTAHIANAYRRPGAVLFGPENSEVFAAPDGLQVFHDRTCPYHPCIQWTCRNPSAWCMAKISADSVTQYLGSLPG